LFWIIYVLAIFCLNFGIVLVFVSFIIFCFLVCPEVIAFAAGLCFAKDVLFHFFSMRDLRDGLPDWREILHNDQY